MLDISIPKIVVDATSYSPSMVSLTCRPITCVTTYLSLHSGDGYCRGLTYQGERGWWMTQQEGGGGRRWEASRQQHDAREELDNLVRVSGGQHDKKGWADMRCKWMADDTMRGVGGWCKASKWWTTRGEGGELRSSRRVDWGLECILKARYRSWVCCSKNKVFYYCELQFCILSDQCPSVGSIFHQRLLSAFLRRKIRQAQRRNWKPKWIWIYERPKEWELIPKYWLNMCESVSKSASLQITLGVLFIIMQVSWILYYFGKFDYFIQPHKCSISASMVY